MEIQDIIISNKLIADFMQYDDVDCSNCKYSRDCNWIQCGLTAQEKIEELKYHSSWDRLMPVIRKIINIIGVKTVDECSSEEWFQSTRITRMYIDTKIEHAFHYVVEFIKWYNSCQK